MATNLREEGFEELFTNYLVETNGYELYRADGYDASKCVDLGVLFEFLEATQPVEVAKLRSNYGDRYREIFWQRVEKKIALDGILHVLRKGVRDRDAHLRLMYFEPVSALNPELEQLWRENRFAVARQLYFSTKTKQSLDMVIFINGIPLMTFELKNLLTGQTYVHAIKQYKEDRSPREELFKFNRTLVHFALDTEEVYMTTKLAGAETKFLPFNRGTGQGAGNPSVEDGVKVEYLWREVLTKSSVSNLIQKFIHREKKLNEDERTHTITRIFPRYHQLQAVRSLVAHAKQTGPGQRYLIQHSAGSGKSNSISWLTHQLAGAYREKGQTHLFDTIIIVTDRRVLDDQLRQTVQGMERVDGLVEAITRGSRQLKQALVDGKRVVITTIQKFPYVVEEIESLRGRSFAIIIDEAHSSTGGELASSLSQTLKRVLGVEQGQEIDGEDLVALSLRSRKLLANASYFAFTATPKEKTLELFGTRQADGSFAPFHSYTMRQAIEEGFILDVLANYTTYQSYYGLVVTNNPEEEYDVKETNKQLRRYVESNPHTIEAKARIMLTHFYQQVYKKGLLESQAKAMVVTSSRQNAVRYHFAFQKLAHQLNCPLGFVTAFSGEVGLDGTQWTEASLNGFGSKLIPKKIKTNQYQFLICANKYQTGYDEPLLQTMYVDKKLGGVGAVQTLSRLNRAHKGKDRVFVLDFANTEEDIKHAFDPYYTTTLLGEGTDPNRLNDLRDSLEHYQVYTEEQVRAFAHGVLAGQSPDELHALLDNSYEKIKKLPLHEIDSLKKKIKSYTNLYGFVSQILTFESHELEELYQFLRQLSKKLVQLGSQTTLLDQSVLESVDFDSYRNQLVSQNVRIQLEETDALRPRDSSSAIPGEQNKDSLAHIVESFNERFGTDFTDEDDVHLVIDNVSDKLIAEGSIVNSYQSGDTQNRLLVLEKLLNEFITGKVDSHMKLFDSYNDNKEFREYFSHTVDKVIKKKLRDIL